MITRTHAAATLLTAGLVAGAAFPVIAQDATGPTSSDLYKKGVEQLQAGSLKEAKETLERVDPLQLPEGDRAEYFAALKKAEPAAAAPAAQGDQKPAVSPAAPSEKGADALSGARAGELAASVAAGDEAMDKKLYAKAAQNYAKAHELAPEDATVAAKLAAAQSEQSKHAGAPLAVDLQRYEVEHQKVVSEFNADMEDAKTHLTARDYVGASRMASVARAHANQGREWLSVAEYEAMQGKVGELVASIDAAQLQSGIQKKLDEGQSKKRDASAVASEDKAVRVNQLLLTARALQRNGQNVQALNAAEQALAADPGNMAAEMLTEMLRDELYLRKSDQLLKEKANHFAQLGLENREAVIPYTDLINYPTDWPQLSERRINAATGASVESDVDRNTRHLLDEKIIETAAFNGDSLETALNYVRDATGVNMVVVWGAIETTGIKRDRAVTQPLKRVSAAQLLKTVLELVSSDQEGENKLGYAIDNGVVKISTRKDLKTTTAENIYDIHDLLVQVPNFTDAPSFSLTSALASSGGGGGGGADIFKDTTASPEAPDENKTVEELITRIKEHVGTKAEWDDNLSVISAYHSQLLVKTTPENHRALARLLESFRQTRSVQISVESRFLFVDNNFLEEFGVDLDMTFAGNNGLSPISVQQGSAPTQISGGTGIAVRPAGSLTPASFKSGASGGAPPQALTLGASYLSDLQVDLLITATQARKTGITLTAPRVTFFNGQRAYVLVGRQVAFISDLTPVQNTSAAKATISTVQSGVVLDVEGTTSADRRYVTLTLRPSLATLKDPMRQIEIRAANVINNFNNNNNNNNNNANAGGNDNSGTVLGVVEAPELELTQIRTTVSIPDRGTLMTGGQRLVSESTVEAGVPVLSKIPLIDRLFTNSSQVKDERTLLILIKPTIILQNEEEENRWPGGPQDWSAFNTTATPQAER